MRVVCYTAVLVVFTQRSSPQGGALRDNTKNGFVADYKNKGTTWSRGTNSRLPFGVNVNLNLSNTYNNFEISLVLFMPNIPTNHTITYTSRCNTTV